MQNLNDMYYFARVVEHGGFASAARAVGIPKSKLSRRIATLEERLGVQLLYRSSRHFSVTGIGQEYYRHCLAIISSAEAAQATIDNVNLKPQGLIRMACPPALLAHGFGELVSRFMAAHPRVDVQAKAFNRRVDVIGEGFDLAICSGESNGHQTNLITRKLGEFSYCLVASPMFLAVHSQLLSPADLASLPGLEFGLTRDDDAVNVHRWDLVHADGSQAVVQFRPRLISDDVATLRLAALSGVGVAQLPNMLIDDDLTEGTLAEALPTWRPRNVAVSAVFPSRRGQLPSIRAFLDFIAKECIPFRRGTFTHAA